MDVGGLNSLWVGSPWAAGPGLYKTENEQVLEQVSKQGSVVSASVPAMASASNKL